MSKTTTRGVRAEQARHGHLTRNARRKRGENRPQPGATHVTDAGLADVGLADVGLVKAREMAREMNPSVRPGGSRLTAAIVLASG
jgi:hypothetical protein